MPWLSILNGLLTLANFAAKVVHDKQLMDAGAAKANLKAIKNAQKKTELAIAAGNAAANDGVSDPFRDND